MCIIGLIILFSVRRKICLSPIFLSLVVPCEYKCLANTYLNEDNDGRPWTTAVTFLHVSVCTTHCKMLTIPAPAHLMPVALWSFQLLKIHPLPQLLEADGWCYPCWEPQAGVLGEAFLRVVPVLNLEGWVGF